MLTRLEVSIRRQQQFIADASHELWSPLTRLRSELEVDLGEAMDPARQTVLRSLLNEVVGLQQMVGDLLNLARVDAPEGKPPARR